MTLPFLPPDVLPKLKEYRYGGIYRPLGFASVPSGYTRVDPPIEGVPQTRFGVVVYPHPLPEGQVHQFQLSPYVPREELVERLVASVADSAPAYLKLAQKAGDGPMRSRFGKVFEREVLHSDAPDSEIIAEAIAEVKRRYGAQPEAPARPKPLSLRAVAHAIFQLEHAVDEPERLTPAVLRVLRAAGWREGDPVHDPRADHDNRHFDAQAVVSDLSGPDFDLVSEMWR